MAIFKITWPNGEEEIVTQADRDTVEGYIDCRFGANFNPSTTKVELVVETVTYPDGTVATGVAPLPKESPKAPKGKK